MLNRILNNLTEVKLQLSELNKKLERRESAENPKYEEIMTFLPIKDPEEYANFETFLEDEHSRTCLVRCLIFFCKTQRHPKTYYKISFYPSAFREVGY